MFEAFPGNYVWNLSVNVAIAMGGAIGEIDEANRKVLAASKDGADAGTAAFFDSWSGLASRVAALADADARRGRDLSAAQKYARAAGYFLTAERMQSWDYEPRKAAYRRALECFRKANESGRWGCEILQIPYAGASFGALYVRAEPTGGRPAPCVIFCNGLDSFKEMLHLCGVAEAFRSRGVSVLLVDQPGTGDALRLHDLHAIVESERWASAAVDYLCSRADVDPLRIGMTGWSLGGYYAPRAAAFEKRFALCAIWGANHNWGEVQKRRLAREGSNPVPHYWEHVLWVFGKQSVAEFMEYSQALSLRGVIEKITVPFLVTHAEHDRQISVEYAHQSYEQAVNSPTRELRIFTRAEGGIEHCGTDNIEPVRSYFADWIAETFRAMA